MKKTLIIKLHDGTEIRRDITLEKFDSVPFGAPANHPGYLQLCIYIATTGTTDLENTNEKVLTVITPSSIKKVLVEFEDKGSKMHVSNP